MDMVKTKDMDADAVRREQDADRTAGRLHGTGGRLFIPAQDGQWQDTETGTVGPLAELAEAWTAEPEPVP